MDKELRESGGGVERGCGRAEKKPDTKGLALTMIPSEVMEIMVNQPIYGVREDKQTAVQE
ncbi:MAG: hypothetical protein KGL39_41435 [Patescibacteria group bacterium]|nr:hypothetical protein [Patescibacteria group bacterium]